MKKINPRLFAFHRLTQINSISGSRSRSRFLQMSGVEDHDWTTGNDPELSHVRIIDRGAVGDVHEVRVRVAKTAYNL